MSKRAREQQDENDEEQEGARAPAAEAATTEKEEEEDPRPTPDAYLRKIEGDADVLKLTVMLGAAAAVRQQCFSVKYGTQPSLKKTIRNLLANNANFANLLEDYINTYMHDPRYASATARAFTNYCTRTCSSLEGIEQAAKSAHADATALLETTETILAGVANIRATANLLGNNEDAAQTPPPLPKTET